MALTDAALAGICAELYGPDPQFDDLLWPEADDGVCCALRRVDDVDVVVFRGSANIQDWFRDFFCVPHETMGHPELGDVHAGFMLGMVGAFAQFLPLLRQRVVVTGHSLGAARAALFTGLLRAASPDHAIETVVFGEPRAGCGRLRALLAGRPYRSYRNADRGRHDYVTDVPTSPPYCHPQPLIDVCAPPSPRDPWGLLSYHHIELYREALEQS